VQRKLFFLFYCGHKIHPILSLSMTKCMRTSWSRALSSSSSSSSSKSTTVPPLMNKSNNKVGIIGGGVAGLQTAKALAQRGFVPTIFEASSTAGGVWRKNYIGYGIQVPKQLYEFPDFPMAKLDRGVFATGEQVEAYILEYFDKSGLASMTKFNTKVESVKESANKDGWTFTLNNGASADFDFCVVATGMYSKPRLPAFPGQEEFVASGRRLLHSSQMLEPAKPSESVLVLGGGKSAMDIALESSKTARSTTLVESQPHWGTPRKIVGLIPFQYIFLSRFGQGLVSAHAGVWYIFLLRFIYIHAFAWPKKKVLTRFLHVSGPRIILF